MGKMERGEKIMDSLYLIKNGTSVYSLVVPEEASVVENNAAREVSDYFVKATNVRLKTIYEGTEKGPCIYIGHTKFAKKNGICPNDEENWHIVACGENIVLTGGITNSQRGISYAAYHFLEEFLGVRWWNEVEELVPKTTEITVPAQLHMQGTPVFKERKAVSSFANYDFYYLAHSRVNLISNGDNVVGRQCSRSAIETGGVRYVGPPAMCHTLDFYYPPNEYFEEHPDWFGWDKLEQRHRSDYQVCFSNEGLFHNLLERMLQTIREESQTAKRYGIGMPSYFSITLGDHMRHCQCPACEESVKKSGRSGHNIKFTNRIAREVAKVYPDVFLETSAYWDFFEAPLDDTVPDSNVRIRVADMDVDVAHDIYYPTNKRKLKEMKRWSEISAKNKAELWTWDYLLYLYPNFPMAQMYVLPTNLKTYHELGFNSCFVENELSALSDFWCCKQWILCKLLEDPYLDFDMLLNEFLEKYYGKSAAPYLREYLDMIHEACEKSQMRIMAAQTCVNWNYMTPDLVKKGLKLFEKAFEAVKGNDIFEQRLREAETPLYRTIAIRYDDFQRIMKLHNTQIDLPSVKDAAKKVIANLKEIENKYNYPYGITSIHIDRFFIRAIQNEIEIFSGIMNDEESPFSMPDFLKNVSREDVYNIPAYKIIRFTDTLNHNVTRMKDNTADSNMVLCYKAIELAFSDEIKDVSKWNIPIVLVSEGKEDRRLEITKADLEGGDYKWFKIENVSDIGYGTMSYLYVKAKEDLAIQLSPLTDAFPLESCDIYVSVKAKGHSFGGDKDAEDVFYFDRFVIVRRT